MNKQIGHFRENLISCVIDFFANHFLSDVFPENSLGCKVKETFAPLNFLFRRIKKYLSRVGEPHKTRINQLLNDNQTRTVGLGDY